MCGINENIYIYMYVYIYIDSICLCEVNIGMEHVFSVECHPKKQNFIIKAHTSSSSGDGVQHLWRDVGVFREGIGHCLICNKNCKTSVDIDLFMSGPSCKKVSKMNNKRKLGIMSFCSLFSLLLLYIYILLYVYIYTYNSNIYI